ncbi:MAG: MFS transporter, partial [Thermoguttaceae bacterium]|nr:MFS transporter [Thermoguttaceae bacterium]
MASKRRDVKNIFVESRFFFRNERRGKALGLNGGIIAIGGMSGPALGGILIHFLGWHAIFYPCI